VQSKDRQYWTRLEFKFLARECKTLGTAKFVFMYNVIQNVKLPTTFTINISSLTDVMIINSLYYDNTTDVLDFGYSDLVILLS
jgi:hypothetical protein